MDEKEVERDFLLEDEYPASAFTATHINKKGNLFRVVRKNKVFRLAYGFSNGIGVSYWTPTYGPVSDLKKPKAI